MYNILYTHVLIGYIGFKEQLIGKPYIMHHSKERHALSVFQIFPSTDPMNQYVKYGMFVFFFFRVLPFSIGPDQIEICKIYGLMNQHATGALPFRIFGILTQHDTAVWLFQ